MHLILIIIPLLFQIIFGKKAVRGLINLSFGTICFISFLGQIIVTILAFNIVEYYLVKNNNQCGMAFVGLTIFSFLFALILIIIIFNQNRFKNSYEEENN